MTSYSPQNTTVVILAAGHGTRMMPLTANTPKPLLKVGELSLIEHHLINLQTQGFKDIVINLAYLGHKIKQKLGDGNQYKLNISYSDEADTGALETAGGIKAALPLIVSDPFVVVNADIWTDFDFATILTPLHTQARLVMVNNPSHHLNGDFGLNDTGLLNVSDENRYTFSGIALYEKTMFDDLPEGKQALAPVFRNKIASKQIEGTLYKGEWQDIGTPERLKELNLQNQLNGQIKET